MDREEIVECVQAVRGGDAGAFERLVGAFQASVLTGVLRVVGDYHLAQEVSQDAFMRAHNNLHRLEDANLFGAWLRRIARNIAVDRLRARVRDPRLVYRDPETMVREPSPHEEDPSEGEATDNGSEQELWVHVAGMPTRERRLMVLCYVRGLSHQQIAEECGMSVGNVKITLHRGRVRLGTLSLGSGSGARLSEGPRGPSRGSLSRLPRHLSRMIAMRN